MRKPAGAPSLPSARGRRVAKAVLGKRLAAYRQRPDNLGRLAAQYEVGDLIQNDGKVPVQWWTIADNFGDLLSPWLVSKMTGHEVVLADPAEPHYVAIGSILSMTNANSHVWGTGSFGVEDRAMFAPDAVYHSVRGPLSRQRLVTQGVRCPVAFGDPALLVPAYFAPRVEKTHRYGIVARWRERRWQNADLGPGVKLIDLGNPDVEGVIEAMLSCRRIVTGSLHGLVMADAYGIPSAWVKSRTALGGEYKFLEYFSTVGKFRSPQRFDTSRPVTAARLRHELQFDSRPIVFDHRGLLDSCPFLVRKDLQQQPTRVRGQLTPAST